jgi:hypothetical protein
LKRSSKNKNSPKRKSKTQKTKDYREIKRQVKEEVRLTSSAWLKNKAVFSDNGEKTETIAQSGVYLVFF